MAANFASNFAGRAGAVRRALPIPRTYRDIKRRDVWTVVIAIGVVIGAMWLRHDGLSRDWLTQVGELTALYGTYLALVGILFASRAPWLDQVFGADGLRTVHKWLGFGSVWLIGAHGVFSTFAYAGGAVDKVVDTLVNLVQTVPGMLGAVVGGVLFVVVAVSSMRAARRRVSYETWHGIHLYVYLAVAFAFLHQLTIGADFTDDSLAVAFWIALYAAAFVPLFIHRLVWPVWITYRFAPEVNFIEREGDGVASLYIRGRNLDQLACRAGQYFVVRALTLRDWMHGHPFSLSAAPNGQTLRFTYKEYGEGTRALSALKPGTPLMLEGPYGAMHGARRSGRRLLFIAAGIGIAPIRAMAEAFRFKPGEADLIFRARNAKDAPLLAELEELAHDRGIRLHLVFGIRRTTALKRNPVAPSEIRRLVPDAADRDVYLCGPESFMRRVRSSLLTLGTRPDLINTELFNA